MQGESSSILVVDAEIPFVQKVESLLSSQGLRPLIECSDARLVPEILEKSSVGLVLIDITMPSVQESELLSTIVRKCPSTPIVVVSAQNDISKAVRCIREGAVDYLVKPVDHERLLTTIRNAFQIEKMRELPSATVGPIGGELKHPHAFSDFVTCSGEMHSIFRYIEAIAQTTLPVLITGETGTGKEIIARSVHVASTRAGEFVPLNVAGLDENLFCDTLFGHEKGAYTGADRPRSGLIEKASRGTLFLDEIGDLSMDMQVRLLRLLQERQYYPVGSDQPKECSARIVAATHRNLSELVAQGTFRHDLFYRLQYHQINLPALRKRRDDIEPLLYQFVSEAAHTLNKPVPTVNPQLFSLLNSYAFPGNVRELQAMVFDAVSRNSGSVLSLATFREKILGASGDQPSQLVADDITFPERLPCIREVVDRLIEEALKRSKGNQTVAAQWLGITRRALNNRLHRKPQ